MFGPRGAMLLLALLWGSAAVAELRRGETVVIPQDQVVPEDLYVTGGTVDILGRIEGDLVAVGGTVNVIGNVQGDVLSASGSTNIFGEVQGSVRATSGEVAVRGKVGEDVVAGAGRVLIAPGAQVGRDVLAGAGNVVLQGPVGGDVWAGTGELDVNTRVGGDVRAAVGQLALGNEARIEGDLVYRGQRPAKLAEAALVRGDIQYTEVEARGGRGTLVPFILWLRAMVGLFALGLALVLLVPRFSQRAVGTLPEAPWRSLGLGALFLFAGPLVAALIFAVGLLLGGWWLGLFAFALYGLALVASFPVVGMYVGRWLLARFGKGGAHLLFALLVGLSLLTLTGAIPVLGAVVLFVAMLFGVGAMLLAAVRTRRAGYASAA
ncbi:MAG: hypothetical protein ACOZIN_13400 [Myxococcota bacterium]